MAFLVIRQTGGDVKKHVPLKGKPQRTCLACGAVRSKHELLRIACNRDRQIAVDPQALMPGRGAYVCRRRECAELLRKKKALQRSFRQPVDAVVYQQVIDFFDVHDC